MTEIERRKLSQIMLMLARIQHFEPDYSDPNEAYRQIGSIKALCFHLGLHIGKLINADNKPIPLTEMEREAIRLIKMQDAEKAEEDDGTPTTYIIFD
jgi:hypothetical protein